MRQCSRGPTLTPPGPTPTVTSRVAIIPVITVVAIVVAITAKHDLNVDALCHLDAFSFHRSDERGRGQHRSAEIDGGYFGEDVKPAVKAHRRDRGFAGNQSGKRKVVVIVRDRGGNSVPAVFNSESQAASFIRARIAKRTIVHADEASDGITCMSVSRSKESTIKRHTASMARALTWLRNASAPRSEFATISPVRISSASRRSRDGARTTATHRTGIR